MNIDFNAKANPLRKIWNGCIGAGRANEGLRADWQEHLQMTQKDCDFKYIRFHGLLHDDMHIYRIINGQEHYNFQYVDRLFDDLLAKKIRPFIEFGFMPKDLASTPSTQFWWAGHVSPPNDYSKWEELIENCCNHWVSRYGHEEVKTWYFEIWNEPNLHGFWDGTRSQYFELYKRAVLAVKRVSPDFRVGGPATSNFVPDGRFDGEEEDKTIHATFTGDIDSFSFKGVWIEEFLDWCEKENLPVDFVSTHPYPTDFALDNDGKTKGATRHKDSLAEDLHWVLNRIKNSAYPNAELHCTEWSSSPSPRDYAHDFLPEAAYIVRSNLAASSLCDSLSYWVFTDVFEESGAGPDAFHGGFGLINLQGVKKPAFHAYRFLNQLNEQEIARDEGYIFTRDPDNKLAALFYNYPEEIKKTIPISSYPDYSTAKKTENSGSDRNCSHLLSNLKQGEEFVLEIVGKDTVAVNMWIENGKANSPDHAQKEALIACGNNTKKTILKANDAGELQIDFILKPWEIALLVSK